MSIFKCNKMVHGTMFELETPMVMPMREWDIPATMTLAKIILGGDLYRGY